jgi:XapX domain-containing protein
MIYLKCFLAGFILGIVLDFLGLPIPAPTTLAGILSIFAVWVGYNIFGRIV